MKGYACAGYHHIQQRTVIGRFADRHPLISGAILFAALPLGLLAAVGSATTIILLPLSLLLGWV